MAPKPVKRLLADVMENLTSADFKRFCHELLDRPGEPRVRRNRVERKSRLEVIDVLVSTFTEGGAVSVTVEILRGIDLHDEAETLEKSYMCQTSSNPGARGQASNHVCPMSSNPASSEDVHFVDKHRAELVSRVSCLGPILDQLLDRGVIQQEPYDKIQAEPTNQAKMRMLYLSLRAGKTSKDVFYQILEKNEPYLVRDLQGQ